MNWRGGFRSEPFELDDHAHLCRRRHTLVVGLTLVTGCADAMGFLKLGGAFSSVMTGNMVLLGLSIGHQEAALAVTSATAIASYIIGVIGGARIAGIARSSDPVWPRSVTRALTVELVLLAGFLFLWEATIGDRSNILKLSLLAIAAAALGMQGSAVQRFGIPGLSSTYLTGTLTTVISSLAARRPLRSALPSSAVLLALVIGAGAGAACTAHLEPLAPILLVAPLAFVLLESSKIADHQADTCTDANNDSNPHLETQGS